MSNFLLLQSHQAEVIIVKRLIQGRNNVVRVRVRLTLHKNHERLGLPVVYFNEPSACTLYSI